MKARGFTLIELVIVLVLISISAIFSTRFIADMAAGYVGTAERGQALAGARFAMERIKRELSLAYSPSVYVSDDKRCVSFVPVLASGRYLGEVAVTNPDATFIIPLVLQKKTIKDANLAVRADSGEDVWQDYPQQPLPSNVVEFEDQAAPALPSLTFSQAVGSASFEREGLGNRYVLLQQYQVRFCLGNQGKLWREKKEDADWSDKTLMLTNVIPNTLFTGYYESSQLLVMSLSLQTRDGELVLPGQIQVIYEP